MRARRKAAPIAMLTAALVASLTIAPPAGAQAPPEPPGQSGQTPADAQGRVELVELRRENAKVYQELDGSRTAVVSTEAVHYQAPNGEWKEIDNHIRPTPRGEGFVNGAGANTFGFAPRGQGADMVTIGRGNAHLSFGIEGGFPHDAQVDRNTITYPDVLPGADLRMSLHGESLKEMLVLKAPPAVPLGEDFRVVFPLRTNALTPVERDGGVVLEDPHGEAVFRIPKPFMWDSRVHAPSGESSFSEDVRFDLEDGPQGTTSLVLTASGEWLTDPARVYPVYVDPTVFGPNTPSVDTFVQSNILNTPQDQVDELKSGYYQGPESPVPITTRSLLKFNLDVISQGSTINSATLSVWNKHSYTCEPKAVNVHRITSNWNSSVTWPDRPSFETTPADQKIVSKGVDCGNAGYVAFDVRSIVSFWKNSAATNEGFMLKADNESDEKAWKKWASDQAGNKPQLEINYEDSNRTPAVPILQSPASGETVRSVSPTFSAFYDDPDNHMGNVEFQVFRSTDTLCPDQSCAFRWGDGPRGQSDVWNSWTVDRDMGSGQYKWRARSFDGSKRSDWSTVSFFTISAPEPPTIYAGPGDYVNFNDPEFFYSSKAAGASFECVLDYQLTNGQTGQHSKIYPCPSPHEYNLTNYGEGLYTFKVATYDPNVGANRSLYSTYSFTLDRIRPDSPSVGPSAPTSPGTSRAVRWIFWGEAGANFECQLFGPNGALSNRWKCDSNQEWTIPPTAPDGTYRLDVWQLDRAQNSSLNPASGTYVLDTKAPDPPAITQRPPERTRGPVEYRFTGESGATFKCELKREGQVVSAKATCVSPKPYAVTDEGNYEFNVWQIDRAGHSSTPQTDTFVIDRTGAKPSLVRSTSHIPHLAMKARTIDMHWNAAQDEAGVAGYWYGFQSQEPDGSGCPAQVMTDKLYASSAELDTGRYWFKVCAVDALGNVSGPVTTGPYVIHPSGSLFSLSPTLPGELVAQSDTNGLEQFYPFRSFDLGHHTGYANLHSGNLVVQATDFAIPGKGLNTVIRHTYNAHRTDPGYHDNGLGRGWTLSLADADAGLDFTDVDLNTPVVPALGELPGLAAGALGGILEVTDGDGTVHRFTRPGEPGTRWEAPPGVDLRVRENLSGGVPQSYDLVRPDGVVYRVEKVQAKKVLAGGTVSTVFTDTWHVSQIFDRNGNKLVLLYEDFRSLSDPAGLSFLPKIRVEKITRQAAGDPAMDTVVTFSYAAGRLTSMQAEPGSSSGDIRKFTFGYDESGYLTAVTEDAEGVLGDERTSVFGYKTYERDGLNPLDDVKILEYVQDGMGERTYFAFDDGLTTGANRLVSVCDRRDFSDGACQNRTTIAYGGADANTGARDVTVTVPVGIATETQAARDSVTTYRISGRGAIGNGDRRIAGGNVLRIADEGSPTPVVQQYEWAQNLLVKRTDGAGAETFMRYNSLGLVTTIDAPGVNVSRSNLPAGAPTGRIETTFVYDGVENAAYGGSCTAPASGGHPQISAEMWCDTMAETVRTRRGAAGHADARITDFDYDDEGNLLKVFLRKASSVALPSDPDTGFTSAEGDRVVAVEHHEWGGISAVRGPRSVADDVTYPDYDPTGLPTTITDTEGNSKSFTFSAYGNLLTSEDRDGRTMTMTYDKRGNLLTAVDPDGDKASYTYDLNDNRTKEVAPRGFDAGASETDFTTTTVFNENEWAAKVIRPGATESQPSLWIDYNLDGTAASRRNELGVRTFFEYYENGAVKKATRPVGTGDEAVTTFTYDAAGRKSHVLLPYNGNARPERRWAYAPGGTVTEIGETSATSQERVVRFAYDAFGAQLQVLGPRADGSAQEEQLSTYDPWGQLTRLTRRATASKVLTYDYTYDDAGNLTSSSQPTGDEGVLTTTFTYDKLSRLIEQTDPQNLEHWVRYTYSAEGLQKTRSDMKGESNLQRRVVHEYNADGSLRSMVAEDHTVTGGPVETLALCNYTGSDYASGYDSNGNLLKARTVKGSEVEDPCGEPDVLRSETFSYDARDRLSQVTQTVRVPGMDPVTRTQELAYRADGALQTSTWDQSHETTYGYSNGGVLEEVTDWRATPAEVALDSFPAGNPQSVTIPNAAKAAMTYHPDGSTASLEWLTPGTDSLIRRHDGITYDVGGMRKSENVTIAHPATTVGADTGGVAKFDYDLAGRLTSWTSPFRLSETIGGTDSPRTVYQLDDGGNVKLETVTGNDGAGTEWIERTSDYTRSRLDSKTVETYGLTATGVDVTTTIDPEYNAIGEERSRSTSSTATAAGAIPTTRSSSSATSYDPGGHTKEVDFSGDDAPQDVKYVYAADGQVIARTADGKTTYFFYFASGTRLAEQTRSSGVTKARYLNGPAGAVMAEQHYKDVPVGDPLPVPTWTWLLRDADGNVATEVTAEGVVASQRAYDPYGSPDRGGSSKLDGHDRSDLGFQSDYTDGSTGNVAMGPRLYDPSTARFTTADFYTGAGSDASLATDPLTGNRYLFAAANPVAFSDDGHRPLCDDGACPRSVTDPIAKGRATASSAAVAESIRHLVWEIVPIVPMSYLRGDDTIGKVCVQKYGASIAEYASGYACPPEGFPYLPLIRKTDAGIRTVDPYGDGCSGVPEKDWAFDATDACATHDYMYDLLRYDDPFERHEADSLMRSDMRADCDERSPFDQPGCFTVANIYYAGLWVNTLREGENPGGSIATSP